MWPRYLPRVARTKEQESCTVVEPSIIAHPQRLLLLHLGHWGVGNHHGRSPDRRVVANVLPCTRRSIVSLKAVHMVPASRRASLPPSSSRPSSSGYSTGAMWTSDRGKTHAKHVHGCRCLEWQLTAVIVIAVRGLRAIPRPPVTTTVSRTLQRTTGTSSLTFRVCRHARCCGVWSSAAISCCSRGTPRPGTGDCCLPCR